MRRLFVGLVLLVAVVVGQGFYRGWFYASSGGTDGKANPSITLDQSKLKADQEKVKEQVQDLGHKVSERIGGATDKGKAEPPKP